MADQCSVCGSRFTREPGYFLGSIYFNYGVTATIVLVAYIVGAFVYHVPKQTLLYSLTAFCLVFPLWFFRYARALWMAFDELMDPPQRNSSPPQRDERR